ncbi:MAG: hypothetical protein AMK69_23320 [Nitrospira bacterium SG8_3]|nr:MAG: hypothetical protein AMK69_23320 [Nitrospira bacterium SG8_3]
MAPLSEAEEEMYEDILEKISALCKGFLLVADKSVDKATSFCRGLLILLRQLFSILERASSA